MANKLYFRVSSHSQFNGHWDADVDMWVRDASEEKPYLSDPNWTMKFATYEDTAKEDGNREWLTNFPPSRMVADADLNGAGEKEFHMWYRREIVLPGHYSNEHIHNAKMLVWALQAIDRTIEKYNLDAVWKGDALPTVLAALQIMKAVEVERVDYETVPIAGYSVYVQGAGR